MSAIFRWLDWRQIIDVSYHLIAYILLFAGIWLFIRKPLFSLVQTNQVTSRLPSLAKKIQMQRAKKKTTLDRHLELILKSTVKKYDQTTLGWFYFVSSISAVLSIIVIYRLTYDLKTALITGVWAGVIPYAILWIILNRKRAKTSYDLLPAANKLLQKYRSKQFDMYHALMELVEDLDGPIQGAFYSVLNGIQNRRDIEDSVQLFHYQIKTNWSLRMAILLLEGVKKDINIEDGLSRLIREMTEISISMQKEISENRDAIQLGYFPIFAIPITMYINQIIGGGRAFHYYFYHPDGRNVLIFTIVVCTISLFTALMMQKPRNDI